MSESIDVSLLEHSRLLDRENVALEQEYRELYEPVYNPNKLGTYQMQMREHFSNRDIISRITEFEQRYKGLIAPDGDVIGYAEGELFELALADETSPQAEQYKEIQDRFFYGNYSKATIQYLKGLEREYHDFRKKTGMAKLKNSLGVREGGNGYEYDSGSRMAEIIQMYRSTSGFGDSVYPALGHNTIEDVGYPVGFFQDRKEIRYAKLPDKLIEEALIRNLRVIALYNRPSRMFYKKEAETIGFIAPGYRTNSIFEKFDHTSQQYVETDEAVVIQELTSTQRNVNNEKPRSGKKKIQPQGTWVMVNDQARSPFYSSETPDVWGNPMAVATIAAMHGFAAIPKDGEFSNVDRQIEFTKQVFTALDLYGSVTLNDYSPEDAAEILSQWKKNVVVNLEPNYDKASSRAERNMEIGVTSFRTYAAEAGADPVITAAKIKRQAANNGKNITMMAGNLVNFQQVVLAQKAGLDAAILGIGGGGHCTTNKVIGGVADWPHILYLSRKHGVKIPIIVQGGATDDPPTTITMGASIVSIGKSGNRGIMMPGGNLFDVTPKGKLAKKVSGEASEDTKFRAGYYESDTMEPENPEGDSSLVEISPDTRLADLTPGESVAALHNTIMSRQAQNLARNLGHLHNQGRKVQSGQQHYQLEILRKGAIAQDEREAVSTKVNGGRRPHIKVKTVGTFGDFEVIPS